MIRRYLFAAGISILLQLCAHLYGAESDGPVSITPRPRPATAAPPTLRVDSSLVLIPVHVTGATGASLTSLKKEDFLLFEDGVPQVITHFAQDDAPISAGVLLDTSSSMKNKMSTAAGAADVFFQFANPEDEFFLVEFNQRPRLKVPFTRDWSEISREITHAKASGLTALLDAIHFAIAQMKQAHNPRKALILLSDGGDNFSRRNLRQLRAALIESDVQVYALGVFDRDYSVKHTPEERNGPKLLDQVALDTGGHDFPVIGLNDLPNIGAQITRELRNQYILGYAPAALAADGHYHTVALKLAPPNAENGTRAYYRRGYYAPEQ